MALLDDDATAANGRFCPSCGEAAGTGQFCTNCGAAAPMRMAAAGSSSLAQNSTGAGTAGSIPPTFISPPSASTPPEKPRRSWRAAVIALGALGLAAVGVAAVVLTTRTHSASGSTRQQRAASTYRASLQNALSPLIAANQTLSSDVTGIGGARSLSAAKNSASAAQTAVSTAKGAAGALSVPGSDQTLAQQVQQALANENGYVQAVSATLANPSSSQAGQLQTLATSLQSSLVPLNAVSSGAAASVSGTSDLTSWANGAAAHPRSQGQTSHPTGTSTAPSTGSSSSGSSTTPASPYGNGENCGGGVYAGPNTSCPFAQDVYEAWQNSTGGDTVTVQAYSPVTNQTYAMDCAPAGSGITCTGGNNASVSWALG